MNKSLLIDSNKKEAIKAINHLIKSRGLKQREVAQILDIKQPRVSDLSTSKIDKFSLDTLVSYIAVFGFQVEMTVNENSKSKPLDVKVRKVI
jgi:predicted XRE-type DNA-binding protein